MVITEAAVEAPMPDPWAAKPAPTGRRARAVAIERRRFTYLFPVVRE
jgi:hypothetical protein